ncbi:MAG: hypothetical protein HQK51_13440 [Oligoflexia bacterium]|nr:hypothetical protein [Oligoflexia bacterium]
MSLVKKLAIIFTLFLMSATQVFARPCTAKVAEVAIKSNGIVFINLANYGTAKGICNIADSDLGKREICKGWYSTLLTAFIAKKIVDVEINEAIFNEGSYCLQTWNLDDTNKSGIVYIKIRD